MMIKVKDLVKALKNVDQELPITINVYGHDYCTAHHENSHGRLIVAIHKDGWGENALLIGCPRNKSEENIIEQYKI
jgi:hypothetical protein